MQREDDMKLLKGRMPCEGGGQRDAPTSQGMPHTAGNIPPKARRRISLQVSEGAQPC